ncbi:MAG TPA: nucleotide exchange factor GrpE [Trebonia sp.]|jgi:molecular chaperone GrpE|nr:nucleotide exchange factor GrpE [Trebonia sp.]
MTAPDEQGNGPVIRDNRRIDPASGQAKRGKHAASSPAGTTGAGRPAPAPPPASPRPSRDSEPAPSAPAEGAGNGQAATGGSGDADALRTQLAERTADLQRLQAEYANYRKRVDRDRATVREYAISSVLTELLPALDAIGIARDHGELSGGFKSVADQIQSAVTKLGLATYGQKGDAFDPKVHEALTSSYSPDVTEDTCVEIFQPGYKVGERILRPARVAVAAPETAPGDDSSTAG